MSAEAAEDDSDVVWKGSPLYSHLLEHGLLDDDTSVEKRPEDEIVISSSPTTPPSLESETSTNEQVLPVSKISKDHDEDAKESVLLCSARSFMWPDENSLVMEVRVARSVLESELRTNFSSLSVACTLLYRKISPLKNARHANYLGHTTFDLFREGFRFQGDIFQQTSF